MKICLLIYVLFLQLAYSSSKSGLHYYPENFSEEFINEIRKNNKYIIDIKSYHQFSFENGQLITAHLKKKASEEHKKALREYLTNLGYKISQESPKVFVDKLNKLKIIFDKSTVRLYFGTIPKNWEADIPSETNLLMSYKGNVPENKYLNNLKTVSLSISKDKTSNFTLKLNLSMDGDQTKTHDLLKGFLENVKSNQEYKELISSSSVTSKYKSIITIIEFKSQLFDKIIKVGFMKFIFGHLPALEEDKKEPPPSK